MSLRRGESSGVDSLSKNVIHRRSIAARILCVNGLVLLRGHLGSNIVAGTLEYG